MTQFVVIISSTVHYSEGRPQTRRLGVLKCKDRVEADTIASHVALGTIEATVAMATVDINQKIVYLPVETVRELKLVG